ALIPAPSRRPSIAVDIALITRHPSGDSTSRESHSRRLLTQDEPPDPQSGKPRRRGSLSPSAIQHRERGNSAVFARINAAAPIAILDRKSTRLNSSHQIISYAVFCLK